MDIEESQDDSVPHDDYAAAGEPVGHDATRYATVRFMDGSTLAIQVGQGDLDYHLGMVLKEEKFPTVLNANGARVVISSRAVVSITEH